MGNVVDFLSRISRDRNIATRTETPWHSIHGHGWTRDGNRHFYPWPGMVHPWPGLETKSPESSKQLTEAPFFEILSRL